MHPRFASGDRFQGEGARVAKGPAHCNAIEAFEAKPWYEDIRNFLQTGQYPPFADRRDRKTLRHLSMHYFLSGEILYRRSFDSTLLRCIDEHESRRLMEEVHGGNCGPHMNGLMLAKRIMHLGYYWSTMETDCVKHVKHCHRCQVYADQIKAPPNELRPMTAPWPFSMWGMDVIGPINPKASNGHMFILVTIDYFTKWIEAITLASVTAKAVARFLRCDVIARYGVPAMIITDNAKNLNNKAVLPIEVEIPSMRILAEAELTEAEWAKQRYEQLNLIGEKRLKALCHRQCYQQRMARAFNTKVRHREFNPGDLVLRKARSGTPRDAPRRTDSCLPHTASRALEAPKVVKGCTTPPKPTTFKGGQTIEGHHQPLYRPECGLSSGPACALLDRAAWECPPSRGDA
ncbi:hypothetical protein CRG98_040575 [Punica granatum]|uniref:Integrase catalytic domain-containing protein n=1 Tax=Punica granatum TaxID=22663 RepID=A0A2I0I5E4_PUNGR|nr:hypothetical protein CRG98_040575 [Punica granatum]